MEPIGELSQDAIELDTSQTPASCLCDDSAVVVEAPEPVKVYSNKEQKKIQRLIPPNLSQSKVTITNTQEASFVVSPSHPDPIYQHKCEQPKSKNDLVLSKDAVMLENLRKQLKTQ